MAHRVIQADGSVGQRKRMVGQSLFKELDYAKSEENKWILIFEESLRTKLWPLSCLQ